MAHPFHIGGGGIIFGQLRKLFAGRVEISIEGPAVERFLNLATQSGIDLRNIRKKRNGYWAEVTPRDFVQMRRLTRRAGVRVRSYRKGGLPFLCARLMRRPVLLAGLLLFAASMYYLLGFIWFVEVRGLEQLSQVEILAQLAQEGLKTGVRKAALDVDRIERSFAEKNPRVSWAGIEIRGTKAIVEIVERKIPPTEPNTPGDIVAGSDGMITRIIVLNGTPAVKEGDLVRKDQPIILGVDQKGKRTRAKGVVEARTWREEYIEIPTVVVEKKRTGRTFSQTVVRYFGRETIISGREPIPFPKWEVEERIRALRPWRKGAAPIEIIKRAYYEIRESKTPIDPEQARIVALRDAKGKLFVGEKPVSLLSESSEVVQLTHEFAGVRVVLELREDIGLFKEEARGGGGGTSDRSGPP